MSEAPVILLHAGVCDHRMWNAVRPALHDAGRKVATPDLRGFGTRPVGHGAFSHAGDVLALMDGLGADEIDLVGASFGGRVALEVAALAPARVRTLTLFAPAIAAWDWTDPGLAEYGAAEEAAIDRGDVDAAVELNVRFWAEDLDADDRAYVADAQRRAFELGGEGIEEDELEPPVSERLGAITAETLVLVGDRDVPDFMAIGRHLAETLPTAELRVVEGAGHLLALERPDMTSEVLAERLRAR